MIDEKLKKAVEASVPDVLPSLLQRIEEEGMSIKMKNNENTNKRSFNLKRWSLAIAAGFVLFIGAFAGYTHFTPESIIGLDVNPSIELSVNRSNKVLKVDALNQEGETVVGDMKLKNVDLDIVINALIGSMVKNGFIDEMKNSILITVDSNNAEKELRLREHLETEVNKVLESYSVKGAILSQAVKRDDAIRQLAEKYEISKGKASLIDMLIKENPGLDYAEAARLPINDLNLIMEHRGHKPMELHTYGRASNKGYIGEDKAASIALTHAGLNKNDLTAFEVEMDYEDGRMIYEVEFKDKNGKEYEYEIDAVNGKILETETKDAAGNKTKVEAPDTCPNDCDQSNQQNNQQNSNQQSNNHHNTHNNMHSNMHQNMNNTGQESADKNYIGSEKAIDIALAHAGLKRSDVSRLSWEYEKEGGRITYEVEFVYDGYEYEYDIDVLSGKIIEWEKDPINKH